MIALRGEIAVLSKQIERLSRHPSRNRSRRRYETDIFRKDGALDLRGKVGNDSYGEAMKKIFDPLSFWDGISSI
ncbi:hypothetical protein NPIL_53421 [Nephila pilipes]|uniref:Uncharacterized protein n=1 Tax=Nephila pilipes TaxID=299642 RepID=A0A8X6TVV7_NEPPI|nr:hypothetical protein NPIL_53421 [Nephila pilipes]